MRINNKIIYEPRTIYWWHSTNIQDDAHLRQVIKKGKNEKKRWHFTNKLGSHLSEVGFGDSTLRQICPYNTSKLAAVCITWPSRTWSIPGHPEPDLYLAIQNLIYECRNVQFSTTDIFKVTMRRQVWYAPQLFKMTIILLEGSHYSETLYTKGAYGQIMANTCLYFVSNATMKSIAAYNIS